MLFFFLGKWIEHNQKENSTKHLKNKVEELGVGQISEHLIH